MRGAGGGARTTYDVAPYPVPVGAYERRPNAVS